MLQLNNGELFLFPANIWKFKYNFDLAVLQPKIDHLFSLVKDNSKLEHGEALSTVSLSNDLQPHSWDELADFQNWLGSMFERIKDAYSFKDRQSTVAKSWFNKHAYGGLTLEHMHSGSTFVVTSYIKLPSNSGFIEFCDPLEYHKAAWPTYPEESGYKTIPCETNDVLIFPGWMKHRVQPSISTEDRIVMTFNVK